MPDASNHQICSVQLCPQIFAQVQNSQLFQMEHSNNSFNIFFEEKHTDALLDNTNKQELFSGALPYLKRGDSSHYLDQFLDKSEHQAPLEVNEKKEEPKKQNSENEIPSGVHQQKFHPSTFHNFQKHLTVCLRNSIQIPSEFKVAHPYQEAAAKLWKAFSHSPISTKKVLHYIFGERNEHKITEEGLKECGFSKVYDEYSEKVMREARNFLATETLSQIKQGKLNDYIEGKKLKDKQQFKKYVQIFVQELESGFLRKRLSRDKVIELQRS